MRSNATTDEHRRTVDRRSVLAAAGTTLTAGLAGCLGAGGSGSELQSQLEEVRSATADYADPRAALQDGFKFGGPYVPGMGWHFTNPERVQAAAKNGPDRTKPQVLTYLEGDDGLRLGAVEYAVPAGAVDGTPDLFADDGADATETWGTHEAATHVFAKPDDQQTSPGEVSFGQWATNDHWAEFRPPNRDLSAGDTVALNWGTPHGKEGERSERVVDLATTHPDLKTLHVWIHTDNPDGTFAAMNPEYGGTGGHDH